MDHHKMKRQYDTNKKLHQEKYAASSKKRLMTNVSKKFETTMIGALSEFEDLFGDLWGLHSDRPPTQEQTSFLERWKEARTNILNKGNAQLRACLDEISQYSITWDRYHTNFIVKKDNLGDQ